MPKREIKVTTFTITKTMAKRIDKYRETEFGQVSRTALIEHILTEWLEKKEKS